MKEVVEREIEPRDVVIASCLDDSDDAFIEFEITTDELTSDVSLMVSDFATEDDIEETQRLWDTQIHNLRHLIGT